MDKLIPALLLILVPGFGGFGYVLYQRQQKITDQLAAIENRMDPARIMARGSRASREAGDPLSHPGSTQRPVPNLEMNAGKPELVAPPTPHTSPADQAVPAAPTPEVLTEAQREAVSKEVERQVNERMAKGQVHTFEMEDPWTVMERELQLSDGQKYAIKDLIEKKNQEMQNLFNNGGTNGPDLFGDLKKAMDLEKQYDAAIKQTLDTPQQEKYEALKKAGKLHGIGNGVVVSTTDRVPLEDHP